MADDITPEQDLVSTIVDAEEKALKLSQGAGDNARAYALVQTHLETARLFAGTVKGAPENPPTPNGNDSAAPPPPPPQQ